MFDFLLASYAASVIMAGIVVIKNPVFIFVFARKIAGGNRALEGWYVIILVWIYTFGPIYNTVIGITGIKKLFDSCNTSSG
jgi:hypothetical protein